MVGTTGLQPDDLTKLEAAARHARIVQSGNMSLGVNLLAGLVRKAAATLGEDFDIEIVEMHHRMKVDAPSGTALLLGDAAAEGRGIPSKNAPFDPGRAYRAAPGGDIGFATLRGGTVVGDHTVIFAGSGERMELTHSAEDRNFRPRRRQGGPLGIRQEARLLHDGRRSRTLTRLFLPHLELFMDRLLVLVRHGQSEWNLKNLFTGWKDPDLTDLGVEEAIEAGRRLKAIDVRFDIAFTSNLSRAQRTCDLLLREIGQRDLETFKDEALNERDYGDLSGLNKDDARARWGEEQVHIWRRSYDVQPPGGESLKDTVARVLPYYMREILPRVMRGERVLVAAHGNSLRALVMVLDGLTPETIPSMELATGISLVYRLKADTTVEDKKVLLG